MQQSKHQEPTLPPSLVIADVQITASSAQTQQLWNQLACTYDVIQGNGTSGKWCRYVSLRPCIKAGELPERRQGRFNLQQAKQHKAQHTTGADRPCLPRDTCISVALMVWNVAV